LVLLREYVKEYEPPDYLFEGQGGGQLFGLIYSGINAAA